MKRNTIRYPHLLHSLQHTPLCAKESYINTVASVLYNAQHGGFRADVLPESIEDVQEELKDEAGKTAVLRLSGGIIRYATEMEAMCGAASLEAFDRNLIALAEDPDIENIVLHIDSPGGSSGGLDVSANLVAEVAQSKAVYAYTDTMMASAAYWLAAGARAIFASPLADVGSIGVYLAWIDESKFMEKEGLELKLFKAGQHKAWHLPGQLSEETAALLQADVDKIYSAFTSHIRAHRGDIADEVMQGQTFMGEDAVKAGLVDEIVPSLRHLLAELNKSAVG